MSPSRAVPVALAGALGVALAIVLVGCSTAGGGGAPGDFTVESASSPAARPSGTPTEQQPRSPSPAATSSAEPAPRETRPPTGPATLTIPAIGLKDLSVVPYEGTTDDWPGTRIQNRGVGASPYGDRGGVGPGQIGNYLVTAHRLSAGGPLRELPSLAEGDSVLVASGGRVYEYRITESRETSFRSERSLAEQRAAVPGSPGKRPTQAMITISTCATPEDDAAGNFWRDDRRNPEHRIDKIGVLVAP